MAVNPAKRLNKLMFHPIFLCLVTFFCFFVASFLYHLSLDPFAHKLVRQAQRQGVELVLDGAHLSFPDGIGIKQLRVSHVQLPHPPFVLTDVVLHPLLSTLTGDNPGVDYRFNLLKGEVNGTAYRNGELTSTIEGLQLDESLKPQLPLTLKGKVAHGEFDGKLPLGLNNRSKISLQLSDLSLNGMQKLGSSSDSLPIGEVVFEADIKGPLLQINKFSADGAAFSVRGNGNMRLGRTPANSSLNLSLVLTPKEGLDPMLKDLLSVAKKPRNDGSYLFSLSGPLTRLRFN